MKIFELYWHHLTKEAQDELEEFLGGNGNYDVVPLVTIEIDADEEVNDYE